MSDIKLSDMIMSDINMSDMNYAMCEGIAHISSLMGNIGTQPTDNNSGESVGRGRVYIMIRRYFNSLP